jgi:phosphatidate cytidylyltransferase
MKRVVTGLILIPIFVYITVWAPAFIFVPAAAIVAVLCFHEWAGLIEHHGIAKPGVYGYAAGLLVMFLPRPEVVLVVLIALLAMALAMSARELSGALPFAGALLLGVMYIFGSLRAGIALRNLSPYWLLFALSENWVGDIAAFYGGRSLGRHRLAPRVSPAKSWEGSVASMMASLIYAYLYFTYLLKAVPLPWALAIGAAGNVAGQIGDLCESAVKRGAGVKDSGTMLPGHGGWLDRIDSSLFAMPVIYSLATFVVR